MDGKLTTTKYDGINNNKKSYNNDNNNIDSNSNNNNNINNSHNNNNGSLMKCQINQTCKNAQPMQPKVAEII